MSERYLLLVSIGPVQEFIASARKLRDLWFGSSLLSDLSARVAGSLLASGAKLIFPALENAEQLKPDSGQSIANRILAEYSGDDPEEVLAEAKKEWRSLLDEIGEETLATINKKFKKLSIREEMFRQQIADIGEFYGVTVPLADDYKSSLDKANALMAGRKSLRNFQAPEWQGEGLPKNSLDGIRECVTEEHGEIRGLLKKSERLDAMGCVKRFYPLREKKNIRHFDDLASIALQPFQEAIVANGLQDQAADFISRLGGSADEVFGSAQYSEFWFMDRKNLLRNVDDRDKGREAWASLKAIRSALGVQPSPYACILLGDGDKMGVVLDAISSAEGHRIFSQTLADFAGEVGQMIEERFSASLIYSGGDDVMAYVPVHHALECADTVRRRFAESMETVFNAPELKGDLKNIKKPTFSIGMAMVHYLQPLNQVLDLAREAESRAKHEGGRNALAFLLAKRSGANITISGKWDGGDTDGAEGIVDRLLAICRLYDKPDMPLASTLGYQLRETYRTGGDRMLFREDDTNKNSSIVAGNATAAMVLDIFKQKENNEDLCRLLKGRQSVKALSDELVIAKNIHSVKTIAHATREGSEVSR